jgi:hypothetical protein
VGVLQGGCKAGLEPTFIRAFVFSFLLGFQFLSGFLSKNFTAHNKIAITSQKIKACAKREQSKAVFLFHDKACQFFDKRNWEILDFFGLSSVK